MLPATRKLWAQQDRHPGDRRRLFAAVAEAVPVTAALYPGSFVDLAPSFVWSAVTYVDMDRRAKRFFDDTDGVAELIAEHGVDPSTTRVRFIPGDYREPLDVADGSVDLLVSLYAGLISDHCTRYLAPGGVLLVNPSHGDVAMASLDDRYELIGAVESRDGDYRVVSDRLERFLVPKKPIDWTTEAIRERGRGFAYTTPSFAYLFRRVH